LATRSAPLTAATSQPTLAIVQTQSAITAQAASTAVAPTLGLAATRAAPTVRVLSTQVAAATLAPALSTSVATYPVNIKFTRSNQSGPTVVVTNDGAAPVSLAGWSLLLGNASVAIPGTIGVIVPPHGTVTLHFTPGATTSNEVYLGGTSTAIANSVQTGSTVTLLDAKHQPASIYKVP
jgi:hypothetical protein